MLVCSCGGEGFLKRSKRRRHLPKIPDIVVHREVTLPKIVSDTILKKNYFLQNGYLPGFFIIISERGGFSRIYNQLMRVILS